jgi:hypothetical protein
VAAGQELGVVDENDLPSHRKAAGRVSMRIFSGPEKASLLDSPSSTLHNYTDLKFTKGLYKHQFVTTLKQRMIRTQHLLWFVVGLCATLASAKTCPPNFFGFAAHYNVFIVGANSNSTESEAPSTS